MNGTIKVASVLALGVGLGALFSGLATMWLDGERSDVSVGAADNGKAAPLYWVAPMDPNYRRDEPGKSPMGMDLIPVYAGADEEAPAGTVRISPDVINNLGVRTAPVIAGRLPSTLRTVGYVQYDEARLQHIHPRVEGWIENVYVAASGDPVTRGEPLYTLYSPTLVNAQEELLMAWERKNPVLIKAASERLAALEVPAAALQELRETGKVSRTITVNAPADGVVDMLQVRQGMYVKPGMESLSIGSLEHLWVIGELFERQVPLVQVGDRVRIQLDYLPGREWEGRIDYIYPALNPRTRTAQVRVQVHNIDRMLRPGMFAQLDIATEPGEETLLVPREALIRTGSQLRLVQAAGEGRFKSVAVEVGRVGRAQVEVLSGVREGERIVTSAQFLIDSESSKTSDFKRMEHRGQDEQAPAADHGAHQHESHTMEQAQ